MEQQEQQKSAEYMRLAVPIMTKLGIAMTPDNYAVWYEHVSGANIQLSAIIDSELAESGSFSNERTKALYDRFLGPNKEELNLLDQRSDLRRLLLEIQKFAQTGADSASVSTQHLSEALTKLHPEMGRDEIEAVVQDVIVETQQAISSNQMLTEQLNTAMSDIEELKADIEQTKQQAKTDRLTGLANRKSFDDKIKYEVEDVELSKQPLSIIFCDLDLFRELNAKHGHLVGDQVLKVVANILKAQVKGKDHVARYGGEEFTIILPKTTLEHAKMIAETLRNEMASKRIQRKDSKQSLGQITLSLGVASYCDAEGVDSFLQRADRALYQSKRRGRNCISEANPPVI